MQIKNLPQIKQNIEFNTKLYDLEKKVRIILTRELTVDPINKYSILMEQNIFR